MRLLPMRGGIGDVLAPIYSRDMRPKARAGAQLPREVDSTFEH
jgi:hypothetical protein